MKSIKRAFLSSSMSIALSYAAFAVLWIFFSDTVFLLFYPNITYLTHYQIINGMVYVTVTAGILFWLIDRKNNQIMRKHAQKTELISAQKSNYLNTIDSLVDLIESRDAYTAGHSRRVAYYCGLIAAEMQIPSHEQTRLERAAFVHDIGKIAIPDSILLKPHKLTPSEHELIQMHVKEGYRVLQHIPLYADLAEIVRHHHERYDGSGYPEGIRGDAIPLPSHIMAVADSFDAMTTSRIYKLSMEVPAALEELKRLRGSSYHPDVIDAALIAFSGETIDPNITQSPVSPLEEERMSYYFKDSLTGFYTASYLQYLLNQHRFNIKCSMSYAVDMHRFSDYNNRFGWSMGDQFIQKIAADINASYPHATVIRFHGDSFLILCAKEHDMTGLIDTINQKIADTGVWMSIHPVDISDTFTSGEEIHRWLSETIHANV